MSSRVCDVLIVGGGMVGLCIANQLLDRAITSSIIVLDKEPELGRMNGETAAFCMLVCITNPAV